MPADMTGPNLAWPAILQSELLQAKVKEAKVLAVGAGGIGCELLKTLVLTGFENIQVIDMDTIETSNLNRQFLFRKQHVGQSKAEIAGRAVQRFRPAAKIIPHRANIKEQQYGLDFFRSFDIVLNGLDNLEARRHVNRLCLASGTPLVESGTAGYLGQVSVHLRQRDSNGAVTTASECFECQPKAAPKSYPICTIRNTPDKPIHCVVWAKDLLFQRLFGSPEAVTDLDEKPAEAGEEAAIPDDLSDFQQRKGESSADFGRRIFERVFCSDIEKVLTMEELWKARKKPTPLRPTDILEGSTQPAALTSGQTASQALGFTDAHKAWSLQQNAQVFLTAVRLFLDTRPGDIGSAAFDKDDDLAVEFVTAASNLRALSYGIPTQSLFNAKGMAGNIIHAIASTNATIAGMIAVEALKVLAGLPQVCRMSYLQQIPTGRRLITAMALSEPSASCPVCGAAQLQLSIDTATTTLASFIDKVLKKRLAMNEPTVMCGAFGYEEGADLSPEEVETNATLLPLALDALPGDGIRHGAIVSVSDQAQDFSCELVISHRADWDEEKEPDGFTLRGAVPEKQQCVANGDAAGPSTAAEDSEDDFEVIEDGIPHGGTKRKRQNDPSAADEAGPSKRPTVQTGPIPLG